MYALPVVLKATEFGSIDDPAMPIVAAAETVPGCEIVTVGALV